MKIRSLSMVIVLAAAASGAAAGEVVHAASHRVPADRVHEALGFRDTGLFAGLSGTADMRAAAQMPACSTCH
ncbi:MAG TPA: hypothetical protein VFR91_07045 [Dyella sp.]|nr:hypothetical protein [Dyella sp.]